MVKNIMNIITQSDPELGKWVEKEFDRQSENIELIASENIVSEPVMLAMATVPCNKYAEGYPGKRYYGGCEYIDEIENIAIERAKKLFNCDYANVQPHSGAQANMAVISAICDPGDKILGMSLDAGGHLTHGAAVNFSGRYYDVSSYGVDENGYIDYDALEKQAMEIKPKLIISGASAYPRIIDFKRLGDIAKKSGAVLWADIAHIAGLVVAGVHPSPFPYADVVTTTTHKTLRGPRGGLILANAEAAKKYNFNKSIFPGIQGGPLEHIITSKALCFGEALKDDFKIYQENIVKNCKELAKACTDLGFKLVSGGTDNHLILIDLTNLDCTGKEMQARCDEVHITLNKNSIPNEPRSPFVTSGVRVGTAAITSRGFKEEDMKDIANCLYLVATDFENSKEEIKKKVKTLTDKYKIYQ